MARGYGDNPTAAVSVPRERRLATDQARKRLYELVNRMSRLRRGQGSLLKRAVEMGPHGRGGALLIPAVDVQATLERIAAQEDRIEALQDEIEDLMLAQLIAERRETPEQELLSVEKLAASVGRSHLIEQR